MCFVSFIYFTSSHQGEKRARTEEQAIYVASVGQGNEGVHISSSSGFVPTLRSQDLRESGEAPP